MDEEIKVGEAQVKKQGCQIEAQHMTQMLDPHPDGCNPPKDYGSVHPHED